MRIVTWNIKRASRTSEVWKFLTELDPDVALLQEVADIPDSVRSSFAIRFRTAIKRRGQPQRFGTAIFVKGTIIDDVPLSSPYEWVNAELQYFSGNLVGCSVKPDGHPTVNAVSAYSPPWPVDRVRISGIDVSSVKLTQNPDVWVTDLLWAALKNAKLSGDQRWVVGGDLNSSETFDATWGSGNAEFLKRMNNLGLTECLRAHNRKLIPTFKNSKDGGVIHQIDHLFVTRNLYECITNCVPGEQEVVFGRSLSDHLPIIADFSEGLSVEAPAGNG